MSSNPASSPRQFETRLEIAAPPDAVWRAISEAREIARWFAPSAEVVPGPGGRMVWDWGGGQAWEHEIDAWEPEKHLRTRYPSQVDDGRGGKVPLFVDFHIEGSGGKTILRLVHSGFGPDARFDGEFDGISRGWSIELLSLRHYLERHLGRERSVAWSIAKAAGTHEEAWEALCGPEGLGAERLDAARVGERLAFLPEPGAPIQGTVIGRAGRFELAVDAENLGNGFLRVAVERCGGELQVWLWLTLWGRPRAETERYKAAFDATVARLFPAAVQRGDVGALA